MHGLNRRNVLLINDKEIIKNFTPPLNFRHSINYSTLIIHPDFWRLQNVREKKIEATHSTD